MPNSAGRRIVITTFGSLGDIHPYIPIALELKSRGHHPVIATLNYYREKIEALGIDFHPVRPELGPPEENRALLERLMDPRRGTEYIFKELLIPALRDSHEDLLKVAREADLIVTHPVTLAGPVVADQLKLPWVSTVLAPASLFSIYDPFETPIGPLFNSFIRLNPAIAKAVFAIIRLQLKSWVMPVMELRSELSLPARGNPVLEGQHSPQLVLALFSTVMAKPQRDWPPNTYVTGFPFFGRRDEEALSPELSRFLDAGPPPLVFTLGSSAVWTAGDFFEESANAAKELGHRAVLLCGSDAQVLAAKLPEGMMAADYAPYSEILPRARAVIHQGGIGTTAQVLRAGVPMLVVPFSHDQPDNAARVQRLGVARTLPRKDYNSRNAARELRALLEVGEYSERAAEVGQVVRSEDAPRRACDLIESLILNRKMLH
jgi:UDP:flavonoid glycosyltransferase YjiC (YdhE family)